MVSGISIFGLAANALIFAISVPGNLGFQWFRRSSRSPNKEDDLACLLASLRNAQNDAKCPRL
jgi:hypothetical protein